MTVQPRGMDARERAIAKFREAFGAMPESIAIAPGRVNLIGEHTDYNDGFVMPIAIDRVLAVAARRRDDRIVRIVAVDFNETDEFSLDAIEREEKGGWRNYPRGVALVATQMRLPLQGIEAVITSDIPIGAGLSSSAALEVAFAMALLKLNAVRAEPMVLALWCQRAENEFVGVRCGIMDQMAATLGKRQHALLLDCRDLSYEHVPLPEGIAFVVADTGKPRTLAASEYNRRRHECGEAVRSLRALLGRPVQSLRDVDSDEVEALFEQLPDPVRRRARHVTTENNRVRAFAQALREGDLHRAGTLLLASHASLRDDYEVSCPELDAMVRALMSVDGVLGARLTGAGFGGACLAMVRAGAVERVLAEVPERYRAQLGAEAPNPTLFVVHASDGARVEMLLSPTP
jgi:galactokinase